jgi:hypothetical protein
MLLLLPSDEELASPVLDATFGANEVEAAEVDEDTLGWNGSDAAGPELGFSANRPDVVEPNAGFALKILGALVVAVENMLVLVAPSLGEKRLDIGLGANMLEASGLLPVENRLGLGVSDAEPVAKMLVEDAEFVGLLANMF